jgi:hypothetical protein
VLEPGWLPRISADQRQTLAAALAGLYKMAGVDVTREQIAARLPATTFAYTITDDGLVVWTAAESGQDVVYDLSAGAELPPRPLDGVGPVGMPVLDATRLLFSNAPVTWTDWVRTWDADHASNEERMPAVLPDSGTQTP